MKITMYGNFQVDYCSEVHYKQTLEDMGHEVVALQEPKVKAAEIAARANQSDLFIWIHTHQWDTPQIEQALLAIKVPKIAYHLDLYMGIDRWNDYNNSPYFHNIDHFFTVDMQMAQWLNENTNVKGHFMLPAIVKKEAYIAEHVDSRYALRKVMFVGSKGYHPEWPYRKELIEFLEKEYGSEFLHVGGDGETGTVRGHRLNTLYNTVRISVGDTLSPNFDYPYYTSDRLFESVGRGAFTIYPRIKGLEDVMVDKKHLVYYEHGNLRSLKHQIDYYMKRPEEREAIRAEGQKHVLENHTYHNRWQDMLNIVFEGDK